MLGRATVSPSSRAAAKKKGSLEGAARATGSVSGLLLSPGPALEGLGRTRPKCAVAGRSEGPPASVPSRRLEGWQVQGQSQKAPCGWGGWRAVAQGSDPKGMSLGRSSELHSAWQGSQASAEDTFPLCSPSCFPAGCQCRWGHPQSHPLPHSGFHCCSRAKVCRPQGRARAPPNLGVARLLPARPTPHT